MIFSFSLYMLLILCQVLSEPRKKKEKMKGEIENQGKKTHLSLV